MIRPDVSDKLIHFTSPKDNPVEALRRLKAIVAERRLIGSSTWIKGGHCCACFTEAPLAAIAVGLVRPDTYSRFSPYGVMFDKSWVYAQGGRPVIYQRVEEYDQLPSTHRWRHVTHHPPEIDFTWEREWRVHCGELRFSPNEAVIVVPDRAAAEELLAEHEQAQDYEIDSYALLLGRDIAEQYREGYPWRIVALSEEARR